MSTLRTEAPSTTNKYYKHTSYGGLNQCLHIKNGSVLPNCVGYVWGAWYEMIGSAPKLSNGNAKTFYGNTSDGYQRSKTPELGAVACWNDTYGHVAIVVGIHIDHITVAQSNYGGVRWEMVNCYKMSNGLYKSHAGNTQMQGFILLPKGHKVVVKTDTSTTNKDYFQKEYANGKSFTVTTKIGLNLRKSPSTNSVVVSTVPYNKKVMWYGYSRTVNNVIWFRVAYNGKEGYVYGYKKGEAKAPYLTGLIINGKNV